MSEPNAAAEPEQPARNIADTTAEDQLAAYRKQMQGWPQSCGHVCGVSLQFGSHFASPHVQFAGQSCGHVAAVSPHWGWHWALPQTHGCPQTGHDQSFSTLSRS